MKLGVLTVVLDHLSLEDALSYLSGQGVTMVEIGCGGYPGNKHANPEELLSDNKKLEEFRALFVKYNMGISALSCHGNPVHPDKDQASAYHDKFLKTVLLAQKLGIDTVITFSGCPGDHEGAKYPNWVTCPWPNDFGKILEYQWNDVLIPYWKKASAFAIEHGVTKIALELHPGFCVYNTDSMLKLRAAVGDIMGANFDPSHLFWQGINPVEAIRELGPAIYHFHAKDTRIDQRNTEVNGVLDVKSYGDIGDRSWVFRTVGYGHDETVWRDIISMLKTVGYDGTISIEHEDGLMSRKEGLEKAIAFLSNILVYENPAQMWWT